MQEGRTLLEIALDLRMEKNGSSDCLGIEGYKKAKKCLLHALDTWEESYHVYDRFDRAVKELIEAALAEPEPEYLKKLL